MPAPTEGGPLHPPPPGPVPYVPPRLGRTDRQDPRSRPTGPGPDGYELVHRFGRGGRAPSLLPDEDDGAVASAPGASPSGPVAGGGQGQDVGRGQGEGQGRGQGVDQGGDSDGGYGPRGALRVLPLGAGMALLGLGLGFLAIRMRRP
ncbi:hypothetical protein [Streptomyces sp. HPF1205]|uniref:hypothetical protein n=1 Tax=Streptomyces sp. HPF1205 TaxID=2873262 RepID=UPI001CECDF5E|nr:hypothetical protein [Streptomyces sp. HPF1205]